MLSKFIVKSMATKFLEKVTEKVIKWSQVTLIQSTICFWDKDGGGVFLVID